MQAFREWKAFRAEARTAANARVEAGVCHAGAIVRTGLLLERFPHHTHGRELRA
jgi:hypothetical protein